MMVSWVDRGRRFRPRFHRRRGGFRAALRGGIGRVSARLTAPRRRSHTRAMRVRLLGPVEVDSADGQPGPRDRLVLDALAVRQGQPITRRGSRRRAVARGPAGVLGQGRPGLRQPAARDARARGHRDDRIAATGWCPAGSSSTATSSSRWCGRDASTSTPDRPERAASSLERALALWRGDPLTELADWMPGRLEAARLDELRRGAEEDLLQARLDAGRHHDVVSEAIVLAGEQPWRERRWELLALAQYRCGRQRDALASIRTARRALGRELGLDPGSGWSGWSRRSCPRTPPWRRTTTPAPTSGSCPWMGLVSVRRRAPRHVLRPPRGRRGVPAPARRQPAARPGGPVRVWQVVADEGRASCRRCRARGYDVVVLTPGVDPVASLAAARARTAARDAVLCIDQFEEAFTGRDRRPASAPGWPASPSAPDRDRSC